MFSRRRAPVGGENTEHLKIVACFIFTRPLKVIFKLPAENARTRGKQPFSDVHGHFRAMGDSPIGEHRERPNLIRTLLK